MNKPILSLPSKTALLDRPRAGKLAPTGLDSCGLNALESEYVICSVHPYIAVEQCSTQKQFMYEPFESKAPRAQSMLRDFQ